MILIFKFLDVPTKKVQNEAQALARYLKCRHAPEENIESKIYNIKTEIEKKLSGNINLFIVNNDNNIHLFEIVDNETSEKQITQMITKKMYQTIYKWQAIDYNYYKSMTYLVGRSAPEYSSIYRILAEIKKRIPNFKPMSYFDFGSGIGTGVWVASSLWPNSIMEYYLVDISREMNVLSDLIIRGGVENKESSIKNVFHRQFLPASIQVCIISF